MKEVGVDTYDKSAFGTNRPSISHHLTAGDKKKTDRTTVHAVAPPPPSLSQDASNRAGEPCRHVTVLLSSGAKHPTKKVRQVAPQHPLLVRHVRLCTVVPTSAPKPSCLLLSIASLEEVASELRCLQGGRCRFQCGNEQTRASC